MTDIWYIISDIVLPHIASIIINIISFSFLGILVSVALLILMFRKKIMTRSNAVYQIMIRLVYIPLVIIACIYSFGNWGLIRGVYQVVSAENKDLVDGVYAMSVNQFFATDREKDIFLGELRSTLVETEASGMSLVSSFEAKVTGNESADGKPSFAGRILSRYRKEIYKAVLNGVLYAADSQLNTETDPESIHKAIDMLYKMDRVKIEDSVKSSLQGKLQQMIDSHYHAALISKFLLWLVVIGIPFIEFLIYRQVNKKRIVLQSNETGLDAPKDPM